jgi:hypothetical protein
LLVAINVAQARSDKKRKKIEGEAFAYEKGV